MKKIIFSILAVTLLVTSCDKDAVDGGDYSSINVAQEAAEIGATVDFQDRFDNFNSFLRGNTIIINEPNGNSKPNASTSKGGDNGADWIELIWFQDGSETYVHTQPEDVGNACTDNIGTGVTNILHETYSYRSAAQTVHIEEEGTTGQEFAIPADLQALYAAAFLSPDSAIYFADFASSTYSFREGVTPTGTTFDFDCTAAGWIENPNTPGLFAQPGLGSYQLSPAPFPLVGMLATVVTEEGTTAGTLNFAASTDAAVREAIENSFGN